MKSLITASILLIVFTAGCNNQTSSTTIKNEEIAEVTDELHAIFPKGRLGSSELFTGNAYNIGLVPNDSIFSTLIGNVYFEPGARSNWHSHPAGQILIITDGVGYHQIEGQPKEIIKKGDVVKCPPNAKHWHGGSSDTGMQQIYIIPNTEKGIVEWMEPVSDEVYAAE